MKYYRPASDRGHANFGWLDSHHSFSFGNYYDPEHMGISVLRVINDDRVLGRAGFERHPHRDMEIISYILEGEIAHEDSMGNKYTIPAGEVQRMSAGTGIHHSEFNASPDKELHFLQIWILPAEQGIEPSYEQAAIEQDGKMTALVTPTGEGDSLEINQDASLYRLRLEAGEEITLETGDRTGYLHLIKGDMTSGDLSLKEGDGLGLKEETGVFSAGSDPVEALWFDLP